MAHRRRDLPRGLRFSAGRSVSFEEGGVSMPRGKRHGTPGESRPGRRGPAGTVRRPGAEHRIASLVRACALPSRPARSPQTGRAAPAGPPLAAASWIDALAGRSVFVGFLRKGSGCKRVLRGRRSRPRGRPGSAFGRVLPRLPVLAAGGVRRRYGLMQQPARTWSGWYSALHVRYRHRWMSIRCQAKAHVHVDG